MNIDEEKYLDMQRRVYADYGSSLSALKDKCVGNWEAHQRYPYISYILSNYKGDYNRVLDYGCGIGRLMVPMLDFFSYVDGCDISTINCEFTKEKFAEESHRVSIYHTDGTNIPNNHIYDLIYSTICLQHICVYSIRKKILQSIFQHLTVNGKAVIQVGYGNRFTGSVNYFENHYNANSTNAGNDFHVEPEDLPLIKADLLNIGFNNVEFEIHDSPHPEFTNYHKYWLFIHLCR